MWKNNTGKIVNLSLCDSARSHQEGTQQLVHIRAEGEPGVAQGDKHAKAVVEDTVHDEEHHAAQDQH